MKPTSSPHDAVPSNIIKHAFDTIGPSIQEIINSCLISSTISACFRHVVVQPLPIKSNLDVKCQQNYCPISKRHFRCLEKLFSLSCYILKPFQSGFRTLHSTKIALLKVTNDLLLTVDSDDKAVLILLDFSAAFDTISS